MSVRRAAVGVLLAFAIGFFIPFTASGQTSRPLPHPIDPPPYYRLAEQQQMRTETGVPGPEYWQNHAAYDMDVVLSPATRVLRAEGRIRYFNESPDALDRIYIHLRQNLHRADARRNRRVSVTGGMAIGSVSVDGRPLVERANAGRSGYDIDGTIMRIELPEPLSPGASVELAMTWSFQVPADAPRMGQDGEVFYLGFWYPQVAVYDDVMGWNIDQYMGFGEFYMGYADYDVRVTVPEQWLVAATGELQNPTEVLGPTVRERLAAVETADSVIHIVTADERGTATVDSETDVLTWHFRASHVRDFAFGTSAAYVWDAAVAQVPGMDPILSHALYRPGTSAWDQGAEFVRWSVEWLSDRLTPYPYPHMTSVEGIIGGGMEYPMLTLIGGSRTPESLFRTTFHEVAHMWYPMLVGQNEKAFAWMDEGLVSLLTDDAQRAYWEDQAPYYQGTYRRVAGTGMEIPSMRHSDQFPLSGSSRTVALYGKPSVALHAVDVATQGALVEFQRFAQRPRLHAAGARASSRRLWTSATDRARPSPT